MTDIGAQLPYRLDRTKDGSQQEAPKGGRSGLRLDALEVYNWGTFQNVWRLDLGGDSALLTGETGSGKSTLVDAITTLLVPVRRIGYNKAAGADKGERDPRSYVLGHYKSARGDLGLSAKPVALRDHKCFSVILGQFRNEGFDEVITLAQVFWFKEPQGQPARFYVVAERELSIAKNFSKFGQDIGALKKRLRKMKRVEVFDSFPPYGAAFRRRFRLESDQALDLFHQTVSMKSVGDLTDFVRSHMLEPFPVEERIEHMVAHFEDLTRAHEAVLKARAQIDNLAPIVADCDRHGALTKEIGHLSLCRDGLRVYFADHKARLLTRRVAELKANLAKTGDRLERLRAHQREQTSEQEAIKQSILANGGDRIASLGREINDKGATKDERQRRADVYGELARQVRLSPPKNADAFVDNQQEITAELQAAASQTAKLQNITMDEEIAFRDLKAAYDGLAQEIVSLKDRRSNIPAQRLRIREQLCNALGLEAETLPYAGELIEIRTEDRDWEGAAERVLSSFAQSLLVPERHYAAVAAWVNKTHLGARLVYYHMHTDAGTRRPRLDRRALANKLAIKDAFPSYDWLRQELDRRFNHVCCDGIDEFRRQQTAITRNGQIKQGGKRHEKDDRSRIDDRTRYVLGWSNESKIAALEKAAAGLEKRIQERGVKLATLKREQKDLNARSALLQQLSAFTSFTDLDWRSVALDIARLQDERRRLEADSDILKALKAQLDEIELALAQTQQKIDKAIGDHSGFEVRKGQAEEQLAAAQTELAAMSEEQRAVLFPSIEDKYNKALGERRLTLQSCDKCERDLNDWLQRQIDNEGKRLSRFRDKISLAMSNYCNRFPGDTAEVDASVEAAGDYGQMLSDLQIDDLPRFEQRFKELLNENTIREIASFQSQLRRESQDIKERIALINDSLFKIDYEEGRYIRLEAQAVTDAEIREFQQNLRSCTEGALSGSDDSAYSEAKFLEVKAIIERLTGRDGLTDLDKRWTRKVTDVRNWYAFSASERWRADDSEHEHYSDSGGKSGGQKEKLAYTVLAASLAYQYGLDWQNTLSRAFHFVVIDEAFGRGSDESARYGLDLFRTMGLQLLIATPLQKIHIIEPYVAAVGYVHNEEGRRSLLRNLTIEEYRAERALRAKHTDRARRMKRAG